MPGSTAPDVRASPRWTVPLRSRPRLALAAALLVLLAAAATVRVFVVPPADDPRPTDLVMVLGGLGTSERIERAGEVVAEHPGATVVVVVGEMKYCPDAPPGAAELVCVLPPDPATTQGEARLAAAYAREHGMDSITVVTTADQLVRARLRFARCWDQDLVSVEAETSVWDALSQVPYQSAAMVKALALERDC